MPGTGQSVVYPKTYHLQSVEQNQSTLTANATAITATASGTQANAWQLVDGVNYVGTVGTSADSVMLPETGYRSVGKVCWVINAGSNYMQVFGSGTDTINGIATATGIAHAAGVGAAYLCYAVGKWWQCLTSA